MNMNVDRIVEDLWVLYSDKEQRNPEIAKYENRTPSFISPVSFPTEESEAFLDFSMEMMALQNLYGVTKSGKSVMDNLPEGISKFFIDGDDITIFKQDGSRIAQVISDDVVNFNNIYRKIETNRYTPVTTIPAYTAAAGANGVNGEIDEYVKQGQTGDCWLISGIIALNSTETGRKLIKNSITLNEDGSATVSFKGAQASYRITAEDIARYDTDNNTSDYYSNGDNDMLIFEIAVARLKKDIRNGKVNWNLSEDSYEGYNNYDYSIEGGFAQQLIYLMTGKLSDTYVVDAETTYELAEGLSQEEVYSILRDAVNNPETILTIGLYYDIKSANCIDGKVFNIDLTDGGHALAVTNVDGVNQTVTIVNPWDSTEEFTMSWSEFANLGIGIMSSTKLDSSDTAVNSENYYYNDGEGYVDNYFNMNEYYAELMQMFDEIYNSSFIDYSDIFANIDPYGGVFGFGSYYDINEIYNNMYGDYFFNF